MQTWTQLSYWPDKLGPVNALNSKIVVCSTAAALYSLHNDAPSGAPAWLCRVSKSGRQAPSDGLLSLLCILLCCLQLDKVNLPQ